MIDNPDEDNPQGRVVQLVNLLSNSRFDIDYRNPNDNDNTLLHHSCVVGWSCALAWFSGVLLHTKEGWGGEGLPPGSDGGDGGGPPLGIYQK